MITKSKLSLTMLIIGFAVSAVGCSVAPPAHASTTVSVSATPEPTSSASPDVSAGATTTSAPAAENNKVDTVTAIPTATPSAAPVATAEAPAEAPAPVEAEPETVVAAPVAPVKEDAPAKAAPAQAAPAEAPVQVAPVQAAPAVSREVYVGLAGGQAVVDQGRGPVLFPLPAGFPPYVAEHDALGGWARFGTLSPGMTVRMSGLVTGTYTVGQIINVPKHGTTDDLRQFRAIPRVMLQTCVPGTSRMIVVGLY